MQFRRRLQHYSDKVFHVRPVYEDQPSNTVSFAILVGVLIGFPIVAALGWIFGIVPQLTYMAAGLTDKNFNLRFAFGFELLLVVGCLAYVLGRLIIDVYYWFVRHVSYRPIWRMLGSAWDRIREHQPQDRCR